MQVTVTTLSTGKVFSLDIPEDLELENFKAFCEAESDIPASDIVIIYNGKSTQHLKLSGLQPWASRNNSYVSTNLIIGLIGIKAHH